MMDWDVSDEPRSGYASGGWLPPGYAQVYNGHHEPELVVCAALSELLRDYFYEVWDIPKRLIHDPRREQK